jgi:hypothetical protein
MGRFVFLVSAALQLGHPDWRKVRGTRLQVWPLGHLNLFGGRPLPPATITWEGSSSSIHAAKSSGTSATGVTFHSS